MNDFVDKILHAFQSGNLITIFSAVILFVIILPFALPAIIKRWRLWWKEGIEGENKKPDWPELVNLAAMFTNFVCLLLYAYMVVTHGLTGVAWGLEDKLITAGIAAGADATVIANLFVKYKTKAKE